MNNLYAVRILNNRVNGNQSTTARAVNGYWRAQPSDARRDKNAVAGIVMGTLELLLEYDSPLAVGGIVAAAMGNDQEPEGRMLTCGMTTRLQLTILTSGL